VSQSAAFFDVDGTLVKANIVDYYFYFASYQSPPWQQWLLRLLLLARVPYYLVLDQFSRDRFNRVFYRNYRGLSVERCRQMSQIQFDEKIKAVLFSDALSCIAEHQRQGRQIVLVTGSLDFIVAPLAAFIGAEMMLTASLHSKDGHYTGELVQQAVAGAEKARMMREFAVKAGIDLAQSYAYGDSLADLAMLQAVGHPVVVNPGATLRRVAQQAEWGIAHWKLDSTCKQTTASLC